MNNKGFGLKEFVIIIAVIFICFIIIMGIYQSNISKLDDDSNDEKVKVTDDVTYNDLETKLRNAASKYQDDTYQTTSDAVVSMIIKSDFLEDEGYLDTIKDLKTKKTCEGYVEFNQDHMKITYKAYLKCDNYKTKGFDEDNLN